MKNYNVTKWENGNEKDYGCLPESDVKRLLKGYTYDEELDMWFTPKANNAYYIEEA